MIEVQHTHAPRREGLGVNRLVVKAAFVASTSLRAYVSVDPSLDTEHVKHDIFILTLP
jgi:hypothetical protein